MEHLPRWITGSIELRLISLDDGTSEGAVRSRATLRQLNNLDTVA
jgi:hypothetical protein